MKPYYEQDGITIYHGDNCDVLGTFTRESIDLVVTSPPYDDLRTYGGHSWDFYGVAWQLKRVLKPGGVIVWVVADATVDGSETGTSMEQALHFKRLGLNLHDTMLYRKTNPIPQNHNRYEQEWEFAFVLSHGRPKAWNPIKEKALNGGKVENWGSRRAVEQGAARRARDGADLRITNEMKSRGNIWAYPVGQAAGPDHPAPFPEALARDHILSWSNPGDVVLDPFAGSGTTLKMAKETGRRAVGIEVNAEYCDIIKARVAQGVLWSAVG